MKKKLISFMLTLIILCTAFINVSACEACQNDIYQDILIGYQNIRTTKDETLMPHTWIRSSVVKGDYELYYTFVDFSDDGDAELLISGRYKGYEDSGYNIFGIYGYENGYVKVIDNECGDRWNYTVCEGNILMCKGSSGAANNMIEFFTISPNTASLNRFSYVEMDGHAKQVFTAGTTEGSPSYPITKEAYYAAETRYPETSLSWKPISSFSLLDIFDKVTVSLYGKALTFDTCPEIIGGRTMVPMRKIFEAMGTEVTWDESTKSVYASKNGVDIKLSIGQCEMYKNGAMIWLDSAPLIKAGRTLVPVRAVAEAFGCTVEWDSENKAVKIY